MLIHAYLHIAESAFLIVDVETRIQNQKNEMRFYRTWICNVSQQRGYKCEIHNRIQYLHCAALHM